MLTLLGVALCQQGDSVDGLQALQDAVFLIGDDPWTLYNYGYALQETGRCAEAIAALTRAEALSPDDPDIQECSRAQGKPRAASPIPTRRVYRNLVKPCRRHLRKQ